MKIDKNIPVPPRGKQKYPWREMEVGDSFLYSQNITRKAQQTAGSLASTASKRLEMAFTSRTTNDGIRIWRVK